MKECLSILVWNALQFHRLEAVQLLHLKYLVHSIFGAIQLYALHFIDGGIALLRFMQTAYDGEQRGVVTFRLSFKYEPTDVSDEEYCHTNGILAFAVLWIICL